MKFPYQFWLLFNDSLKSLQNLCAYIIIIVPCALYWCKSLWTDVPFHLKIVKTSIFYEAVWEIDINDHRLWNFPLFVLLPVYSNFLISWWYTSNTNWKIQHIKPKQWMNFILHWLFELFLHWIQSNNHHCVCVNVNFKNVYFVKLWRHGLYLMF